MQLIGYLYEKQIPKEGQIYRKHHHHHQRPTTTTITTTPSGYTDTKIEP